MKAHFEMFAAYNAWANRRLFDAAAEMNDAKLKAEAGAFFGSLFGTLNHLLVGDMLWMNRFDGGGEIPTTLDKPLYETLVGLRAARERMDARIIGYTKSLTDEVLSGDVIYHSMVLAGEQTQSLTSALSHFFNHQTHHRGQCHHMLTAAGQDAPPLDLLFFQKAPRP